jgi:hypothetical protein
MQSIRLKWSSGLCAVVALVFACSDDPGNAAPAGRGSAACNEWQSAYCGLVTKCQGAAAACDQVKGFYCKSDTEAGRCASLLGVATCNAGPPAGCSITDIADPVPAQKSCADMQKALCERNEECQAGTRDACLAQVNDVLDCTKAIGITLAFEQCLVETAKISCTSPATPPICKGVVVTTE